MLNSVLALALAGGPPDLSVLLQKHLFPLRAEPGRLEGPGADFLLQEAARAAFFLVGESHGNRETPRLCAELLPELVAAGYGVFAIETGPLTAARLTEELAAHGRTGVVELLRRYPMAVPFYGWMEELELLESAVKEGLELWGLDQEFIAADELHLARLRELAPDPPAAGRIEDWVRRLGFATRSPTSSASSFLQQVTAAELDELDLAFASAGSEARRILRELRHSALIYQHYRDGRYYENNVTRIRWMKQHVTEYLEQASGDPRILFKFGSAHMGRGYSPFQQLDLGNLAAEMAALRGSESFHLYVFGRRGVAPDGSTQEYPAASFLQPMFALMEAEGWTVFDLRPLREILSVPEHRAALPELFDLVFRFDAAALTPELHAADLVTGGG